MKMKNIKNVVIVADSRVKSRQERMSVQRVVSVRLDVFAMKAISKTNSGIVYLLLIVPIILRQHLNLQNVTQTKNIMIAVRVVVRLVLIQKKLRFVLKKGHVFRDVSVRKASVAMKTVNVYQKK